MLEILDQTPAEQPAPRRRLPPWLKRPLPQPGMMFTSSVIEDLKLETVCESAKCPNRTECWSQQTATFMILGNVCTRPCGFCSVPKGKTEALEHDEPERVAEAAQRLGLKYVVITSVTRDDLPDGGAEHFYRCVLAVRARTGATIEVLTPDFLGKTAAIDRVIESRPEVFNHNTETVPRLYHRVRRNAEYRRTLDLLARVKQQAPDMKTKSGLMLGLGETIDELFEVLADLRSVGCDMLTLGQYLQPSPAHLPVERYPRRVRRDWGPRPHARFFAGRQRPLRAVELSRRRNGRGGESLNPTPAPPKPTGEAADTPPALVPRLDRGVRHTDPRQLHLDPEETRHAESMGLGRAVRTRRHWPGGLDEPPCEHCPDWREPRIFWQPEGR